MPVNERIAVGRGLGRNKGNGRQFSTRGRDGGRSRNRGTEGATGNTHD